MKYMGSKRRMLKHTFANMLEVAKRGVTKWVEPLVGGNMIDKGAAKF